MKPRRNKFLRTRGSGFTKQIVEPVSSFSKQFAQPIIDRREKIKAAGGYIFFQLSRIETESLNIMKNAGLPVDDDCRFESLRRGYAHDSPVGYAATQLTICRTIRSLVAEGKFIEACGQAFDLGQFVREEEIKYATTADGPSRGGRAGARSQVLTTAQRREIRQTMDSTPRGQKGNQTKRLARKYRVGERTIQRAASGNFAT
jgi:hypothetical protein